MATTPDEIFADLRARREAADEIAQRVFNARPEGASYDDLPRSAPWDRGPLDPAGQEIRTMEDIVRRELGGILHDNGFTDFPTPEDWLDRPMAAHNAVRDMKREMIHSTLRAPDFSSSFTDPATGIKLDVSGEMQDAHNHGVSTRAIARFAEGRGEMGLRELPKSWYTDSRAEYLAKGPVAYVREGEKNLAAATAPTVSSKADLARGLAGPAKGFVQGLKSQIDSQLDMDSPAHRMAQQSSGPRLHR